MVGFKHTGLFSEYPNLIPPAINQVKQKMEEVSERTNTLVILYEPCKGEDHKVGYFYAGYIVEGEPSSVPDAAE